ncbi:MAG: hypothetical protein ISS93_00285 [Candidatus Aenigmarchaeota archaeon]|nr:hypothetical protein [Candidatus Aenigmarchaeota archaeon]
MNKLLPLLALALPLIVSGCTLPGGIDIPWLWGGTISMENDIVVIKSIQAIPSTVTAPQQVRLIVDIQNQGSHDFSGNAGEGTSEKIKVDLYDHCEGLFKKSDITRTCEGSSVSGETECEIDKILPKEIKQIVWTLKPDENTKLITPCTLKVSVTYPYKTTGLTSVNYIGSQEYANQLARGTFRAVSSTNSLGEGPVKAWFEIKDQQPIVCTTGTPSPIPVTLNIQNKGAGFVDKDDVKITDTNIFVEPFNAKTDGCSFKKNYDEKKPEKLIQKSRTLPCNIMQLTDTDVPKETTRHIKVETEYKYEFRDDVKVTVNPQPKT